MLKTKIFAGVVLITAVLFAQVGSVFAAPAMQDGSITGTVTGLECGTGSEGNTTILVTLEDAEGMSQTVNIDLATADSLGLVTFGEDELPDCSAEAFAAILDEAPEEGLEVTIAPEDVIPVEEESNHPISVLLAAFFGEDASVIDGFHDDGFGFGVIAQSLWISRNLSGDASLTEDILQAKQEKDFETFFEDHPEYLTEGNAVPTNWGQFKKALSEKKNNLGSVVSGHAENGETEETTLEQASPGNGHGIGNGNGNSNKDKDKGNNGKGNGKNK